jgi:N6-adenosine-specific RNA methylase IME4
MMATEVQHRIKWFVWSGGEKMPKTAAMRGTWGYDAECSCGWKTSTGGGTRRHIENEIWFHKFQEGCHNA